MTTVTLYIILKSKLHLKYKFQIYLLLYVVVHKDPWTHLEITWADGLWVGKSEASTSTTNNLTSAYQSHRRRGGKKKGWKIKRSMTEKHLIVGELHKPVTQEAERMPNKINTKNCCQDIL